MVLKLQIFWKDMKISKSTGGTNTMLINYVQRKLILGYGQFNMINIPIDIHIAILTANKKNKEVPLLLLWCI